MRAYFEIANKVLNMRGMRMFAMEVMIELANTYKLHMGSLVLHGIEQVTVLHLVIPTFIVMGFFPIIAFSELPVDGISLDDMLANI